MSHHNGAPKHSEPVFGHGGTKFEGVDAKPGMVVGSLAVIGATLLLVFAVTIFLQRDLQRNHPLGELPSPLAAERVLAPAPQLQVHPWEELPEMRAHENQILNMSGKDEKGNVHTSIDSAMDAVVSHLKIEPNAPRGLTIPGGNGREFDRSLTDMPPLYQTPQIQGEIHKNAQ